MGPTELTLWSIILKKLLVSQLVRNPSSFMEPEGSLPCSQQPAAGHYKYRTHHTSYFLTTRLNIIYSPIYDKDSQVVSSLRYLNFGCNAYWKRVLFFKCICENPLTEFEVIRGVSRFITLIIVIFWGSAKHFLHYNLFFACLMISFPCALSRHPIDRVNGFMYAVGRRGGVCNIIRRNKMWGLRLTEQEVLTFAVFHTNAIVLSGLK
jgi:hypothetical protein